MEQVATLDRLCRELRASLEDVKKDVRSLREENARFQFSSREKEEEDGRDKRKLVGRIGIRIKVRDSRDTGVDNGRSVQQDGDEEQIHSVECRKEVHKNEHKKKEIENEHRKNRLKENEDTIKKPTKEEYKAPGTTQDYYSTTQDYYSTTQGKPFIRLVTVMAGLMNSGVSVASVVMSAVFHHPILTPCLTLHGVAQVSAVAGMAVYADVTAQLQHNSHQTRMLQAGRRKNRKSYLIRKEKRVYRSLSINNLREKTGNLIPLEEEVMGETGAWFYVSCKIFTAVSVAFLLPVTTVGTVIIYSVWTDPSESSSHYGVLTSYSRVVFITYDVLYLGIFMYFFCVNSCSPLFGEDKQPALSTSDLAYMYKKCERRAQAFQQAYRNCKVSPLMDYNNTSPGNMYLRSILEIYLKSRHLPVQSITRLEK
nr:uncharacterized protein LOC128703796 [Cherax quadricarinatus]